MECKHERLEETEGYVFCVECGLEIEKFFGYSYSGCKKKKEKNITATNATKVF